ncbi:type II toxin-antitoxin system VapC family toxin [Metallosphaera javensis (ex Sakai et al. 2022)]|uniref:type II toxin-antitoxin system VapC family toxin n=1 Tax=Metallosphaera javensis (ex Sakai et al. 2022) TaxID=2775498 RepID=UPI00258ADBE6|nr:MAG: tRNA(fMet)-specific endonuclease VapC [Metallosphaera javensis (ex Sakai et al. 2022)]
MRRYFDVNVFIYYFLKDPFFGDKAYEWLKNTDERITCVITPFEVTYILSKILNISRRDSSLIYTIINAFSDLDVRYVSVPWENVPGVMRKYNLDFEDAIHVACALKEMAEIVSNDQELMKKVNAKF